MFFGICAVATFTFHMGVSKNRGETPKMDGENNGKPYEQMDDLGGFPIIFGNSHIISFIWILDPLVHLDQ